MSDTNKTSTIEGIFSDRNIGIFFIGLIVYIFIFNNETIFKNEDILAQDITEVENRVQADITELKNDFKVVLEQLRENRDTALESQALFRNQIAPRLQNQADRMSEVTETLREHDLLLVQLSRNREEITQLQQALQSAGDDRYRGSDAQRDLNHINSRFDAMNELISRQGEQISQMNLELRAITNRITTQNMAAIDE